MAGLVGLAAILRKPTSASPVEDISESDRTAAKEEAGVVWILHCACWIGVAKLVDPNVRAGSVVVGRIDRAKDALGMPLLPEELPELWSYGRTRPSF